MRFYVSKQYYPDHRGVKLESFAIWMKRRWHRREFLAYSWSLDQAWVALQVIRKGMKWNQ